MAKGFAAWQEPRPPDARSPDARTRLPCGKQKNVTSNGLSEETFQKLPDISYTALMQTSDHCVSEN
jgi:hypothetical protein